ncbi:MAG: hypothetical protein M3173_03370, partial [Chloroflexota bacterium]|nr:hypothetical protein [Chloroflexota bacterium]
PIRTVGEHEIEIHLVGKLRPTITVVVQPEGGLQAETEETAAEAEVPEELKAPEEDLAMDEEAVAEVTGEEDESANA